jgi:hypothetical protein
LCIVLTKKGMSAKYAAPALPRAKSKRRGAVSSVKAAISAKYFGEDGVSAEGDEGISGMKDIEADYEFQMLALDGSAAYYTR